MTNGNGVRVLAGPENFYLLSRIRTVSGHTQLMVSGSSFYGVKRPGRKS